MILRSLSAPDAEKFYTLMCTAAGRELPREAFAQALAQALEQTGRRIVLAFEGPEAVGFADTEVRFPFSECAPVGVIHEFYVREDARGRNVGSAMLVSLTTQFKAAGCVSVQASCARVNLKSQEFLEKRGFVKTRHAFCEHRNVYQARKKRRRAECWRCALPATGTLPRWMRWAPRRRRVFLYWKRMGPSSVR